VISARQNPNSFVGHLIDKPMLIINSLRPATDKLVFERLGFADSAERVALGLLNQAN
jgi:hypothetical protein